MRNRIAAVLLLLSWPVCLIHKAWNNYPLTQVHWVVFDKTVYEDFRWPIFHAELWLSAVFVLLAWLIAVSKTRTLRILIWANLIISAIDIVHYWLFFRRNEWFLAGEGMVMVVATIIITTHASTHENEKAR
jgi:hypothetical protein